MEIIGSEKATEKLMKILLSHGFNSGFLTGFDEAHYHLNQISKKAEELNFEIPPIEQRFYSLFHNLGAGDFEGLFDLGIKSIP